MFDENLICPLSYHTSKRLLFWFKNHLLKCKSSYITVVLCGAFLVVYYCNYNCNCVPGTGFEGAPRRL